MSDPATPPTAPALQFDRAVTSAPSPTPGVTCAQCGTTITDSYFTLEQKTFCASCKANTEAAVIAVRNPKKYGKAFAYGLGAAIAGAIVYYSVIALFDLEIGIVAILIGYMVGYAIRNAIHGLGSRRFQILAAALTYMSVGLAYVPLAFRESGGKASTAAADSSHVAKTGTDSVKVTQMTGRRFALGVGATALLAFALPVMVVIGSMPSGLISALIIGIGIRQAWQMTAAPNLSFHGPLRVAPPS